MVCKYNSHTLLSCSILSSKAIILLTASAKGASSVKVFCFFLYGILEGLLLFEGLLWVALVLGSGLCSSPDRGLCGMSRQHLKHVGNKYALVCQVNTKECSRQVCKRNKKEE